MNGPTEQTLEVDVDEVVFQSPDGRFAVVKARRTSNDDVVTAVGDLGQVARGETLRLRGRVDRHPRYGERFRVASFTPVMPTTDAGIVRYLGSGLVPGIGPALAARLVERFGAETLEIIATRSTELRSVDGIGKKRAGSIAEAVRVRRDEAETLSFLHGLGFGPSLARRILKRYGRDSARVLRDDPYLVAEQVHGIGFRTADRAGRAVGIGFDDPRRAAGAVLHLLGKAADDGDVFSTEEALRSGSAGLDVPEERVTEVLPRLALAGMVILEGDAVYAPLLHRAERRLARRLREMSEHRPKAPEFSAAAKVLEEAGLSADQRQAVETSLGAGLMVLTGGPGTGKTTTVRALVAAHRAMDRRVLLCAPTGRAAKRLFEATGAEAKTIHRLLEWNPVTGGFKRGEDNPLDAETILVDEASMVDLRLADSLAAAIPPTTTLILVGDTDQLPPVGPGQVLADVIASGVADVVRLVEIFRQAQKSAIVRGAHQVLRGDAPTPTPRGDKGDGDLFIVRAREPDAIIGRLVELVKRVSPAYSLDPKRDLMVLAPTRRGPLGTERLNEILQAELNPTNDEGRPGAFRRGDKVMQLRNDYDRDVYNGDLGEIRRIEGGITYVLVDGREVKYRREDLDALGLAYATTIHKVQGSELPGVIVVLHPSHHMLLGRSLLYTAITRAKKLVVLLGDGRAMDRAIRNVLGKDVRSRLRGRLLGERYG